MYNKSKFSNLLEKDIVKETINFGKDIIIIIIIVMFIRTFLFMPFQINGQSMYDSYYDKQFIIVDRFSTLKIPYIKDKTINRGDVVVFKPGVSIEREYFIKRIIGLPGDKLKIENGKVYLFDKNTLEYKELIEEYLSSDNFGSTFVTGDSKSNSNEYIIPPNSYFVMGDNRLSSTDSRACFSSCSISGRSNYINENLVTGKVLIDLGYYDWLRIGNGNIGFGTFKFIHPDLGISTFPKWFDSARKYQY